MHAQDPSVTDGQRQQILLAVATKNTSSYTPAPDGIGAVPPARCLIADSDVYDSNALRDWLKSRDINPVIPPRSNRKAPTRSSTGSTTASTAP